MFNQFQDKLNIVFIAASMGLLALVVKVQFRTVEPSFGEEKSFVYEMPRPKSFSQELDLSQRGIQREVTLRGIPKIAIPGSRVAGPAGPATPVAKTDTAKKLASGKAVAKAAEESRGPIFTSDVVNTDREATLSESDSGLAKSPNVVPAIATGAPNALQVNSEPKGKKQSEEPKLSFAEWRNILLTKPTQQSAYELIKAYRQGDLDAESYYKIVSELLNNSGAEQEEVALYMLSSDSSGRAFALMVAELPTLRETIRPRIKSILDDYAEPTKFSGLAKALYTKEVLVVKEALRLVTLAIQHQDSKVQTNSGRETRGIASPVVDQALFLQFLPGLQRIAVLADVSIGKEAQSLTDKIKLLQGKK